MIILHRFCMVSVANRSRQVGEALLEGDHTVLMPDERVAQMYAHSARNLGEPLVQADQVLRVIGEAWGYLPTLVQYRDEQAGLKLAVSKRQQGYEPKDGPWFDEAAGWFNAGYTTDPPEDEAASEPKEDPGPFFRSEYVHWEYPHEPQSGRFRCDSPGPFRNGETFTFTYTGTV